MAMLILLIFQKKGLSVVLACEFYEWYAITLNIKESALCYTFCHFRDTDIVFVGLSPISLLNAD